MIIVEILGIDADLVGVVLLVMGVAGVAGSFTAGAFLTRTQSVRWSLAAIIAVLAGALILTPVASLWLPAALVGLLVWAAGYAAAPIGLQTTVFRVAPAYRESATTALLHDVQLLDRRRRSDRRTGDRARRRAGTRRRPGRRRSPWPSPSLPRRITPDDAAAESG